MKKIKTLLLIAMFLLSGYSIPASATDVSGSVTVTVNFPDLISSPYSAPLPKEPAHPTAYLTT